jgi:DNA (cytosine-5)-methyltransferase 1
MKRALDLFCGAGGATCGLQEAGYHVTGVDIAPQPHYCGDKFIQADALTFPLNGYDLICASPKCQGHTRMNNDKTRHDRTQLTRMISRLECQGTPWALENVPGAPMGQRAICLCGSMFGLGVSHAGKFYQLQRHRLVLASWPLKAPVCAHSEPVVGVYGAHARCRAAKHGGRTTRDPWDHRKIASAAMQIGWMTLAEMSEAIPPVYSRFIACQL